LFNYQFFYKIQKFSSDCRSIVEYQLMKIFRYIKVWSIAFHKYYRC